MILDQLTKLSSNQVVGATALSQNSYDLGNTNPVRNIGAGEPLSVLIAIGADAVATGTYQFDLIESDADVLSAPTVLETRVIAPALLKAGSIYDLPIPMNYINKRYLGVNMTLGGTSPGVTVSLFIIPTSFLQSVRAYAKGYTIA